MAALKEPELIWEPGAPLNRTTTDLAIIADRAALSKPAGHAEALRHIGRLIGDVKNPRFSEQDILMLVIRFHNECVMAFPAMEEHARWGVISTMHLIENFIFTRAALLKMPLESAAVGRFRVIRVAEGPPPAPTPPPMPEIPPPPAMPAPPLPPPLGPPPLPPALEPPMMPPAVPPPPPAMPEPVEEEPLTAEVARFPVAPGVEVAAGIPVVLDFQNPGRVRPLEGNSLGLVGVATEDMVVDEHGRGSVLVELAPPPTSESLPPAQETHSDATLRGDGVAISHGRYGVPGRKPAL